jgi:hypothetical protein
MERVSVYKRDLLRIRIIKHWLGALFAAAASAEVRVAAAGAAAATQLTLERTRKEFL